MNDSTNSKTRVFVAGHRGMVGSALLRRMEKGGYRNILTLPRDVDLRDQRAVHDGLPKLKPDWMFIAAARVGGILANSSYPAEFIYDNLAIELNLIHAAYEAGVKKLLFLGSSCIYPRECPQPIREEHLLSGPLEHTNEPYAVAKIAGVKLCQAFNRQYGTRYISLMPTNLYGPNDNYGLPSSHVIPALIRKAHEAKVSRAPYMEVWGSGEPRREFLHVDDLADACLFVMEQELQGDLFNVGVGEDITIRGLTELIKETVAYRGGLRFDSSKPDGTPRKLLNVERLTAAGWRARIGLREGLADAYSDFLQHQPGEVQGVAPAFSSRTASRQEHRWTRQQ